MIYNGFLFKINNNNLYCYGIGLIKYRDDFKPIFLYSKIDTCIKEFGTSYYYYDLGIIDTQNKEFSLQVFISNYLSIFAITAITGIYIKNSI